MIKLKITQPGWDNYTGWVGPVYFEDSVSTTEMTAAVARQISACVRMEEVTEEGSKPFGISQDMVEGKNLAYVAAAEAIPADAAELAIEKARDAKAAGKPKTTHSLEELEAIASDKGIEGLRPIATSWGVKDRSIPKLIAKILAAQAAVAGQDAPAAPEASDEVVEETAETAPAAPADAAVVLEAEAAPTVEVSAVPVVTALAVGDESSPEEKA
jgi:hypothetical protein